MKYFCSGIQESGKSGFFQVDKREMISDKNLMKKNVCQNPVEFEPLRLFLAVREYFLGKNSKTSCAKMAEKNTQIVLILTFEFL